MVKKSKDATAVLAALGRLDAIAEGADYLSADELWVDMADGRSLGFISCFEPETEPVYHGPVRTSAESIVVTPLDGMADVAAPTGERSPWT